MRTLLLALCLLGLSAAALAATEWTQGMSFAEWAFATGSTDQTKAKTASKAYEKRDVKHLCLKEAEPAANCKYVGCPSVASCPEVGDTHAVHAATCADCQTHIIATSNLVCCDKEKEYGEEGPSGILTVPMKVGSCEWDIDIFTNVEEVDGMPLTNGGFQIGTAWATCYLGAEAEYCGHPFCDRMVISFQGGAFVVQAYTTPEDDDEAVVVDDGCFQAVGPVVNNTATKSGLQRAFEATGLPQKFAAKYPNVAKRLARPAAASAKIQFVADAPAAPAAKTQGAGYVPPAGTPPKYSQGYALMLSGPVSVMAMDKHVEYSQGMLEYVPIFIGGVPTDKFDAAAIPVKPRTYDFVLASDKSTGQYGYSGEGGSGSYYPYSA